MISSGKNVQFPIGIEIWSKGIDQLLELVVQRIESGETTHIVTLNPLMVMSFKNDPEFHQAVKSADFVVADGVGIKWAIKKLYGIDVPLIPGIELSERLIRLSSQKGWGIGLLGARPNVWETAERKLSGNFLNLIIKGGHHGFFRNDEESLIVENLSSKGLHLLLVGMGFPKQEKFLGKYKENFKGAVLIGVGGSLDVFAGKVVRAPEIFRKLGIEWLWRMVREPKRLANVFTLFRFWWMVKTKDRYLVGNHVNVC
jgi:N-acetylglucosaminyldiphosphoundecaprenol N-acetyl-beta-D-mannosaminyltransferase